MPLLTKKKLVPVHVGLLCDCCGKQDSVGLNTFAIDHTLGYDSPMDMSHISAAICDTCLLGLVIDKVPGAVITSQERVSVSREAAVAALNRYRESVS